MMLNAKKKPLIGVVLLLTSLGVTTSCIDNSYDLKKDIDMTINVGGEHLAIPVGYTEKITLDKIIEIDEGDDLQLVDGEYHLLKGDDIDESKTKVNPVIVDEATSTIPQIGIVNSSSTPVGGAIETSINQTGEITASANNIDDAVKEIGSLTAQQDVALTISLEITGSRAYDKIEVPNLKIQLPKFLVFSEKYEEISSDNILSLPITLNKDDAKNKIYTYKIKGYSFATQAGKGEFVIENKISIENNDLKVTGNAKVTVPSGSSGDLCIAPKVTVAAMPITSVTGVIQPKIAPTVTTVNLENLPDFLEDEEVELDITNPIISFIANNPLQTDIVLNGIMYGEKGGAKIDGSTVKIGNGSKDDNKILLHPGDNTIVLSRTGKSGKSNVQDIMVSDINNLIKKIPDVVNVTLEPKVENNEYYTVELKEHTMTGKYDIDIPLSFGSGLKIVYEETINDFDLDLEDVDIKKAIISITADNTIPLNMEIKNENVSALDANGNKIADINVTVEGTITESKDGTTVATSQLNINLVSTKDGAISKLDGLGFKVTAIPGQTTNVQLKSSQWLQLKDMKLKIPNGIKVDLN